MSTSRTKHVASFLVLVAFDFLAIGTGETDSETTKQVEAVQSAPAISVSADDLYDAYKSNEVRADAIYKGKVVEVSGAIKNIGKDILDNAYIVIGGSGFLDGVQCSFPQSGESSVARLSKGQSVVVRGIVSGKMGHVQVDKCSVR